MEAKLKCFSIKIDEITTSTQWTERYQPKIHWINMYEKQVNKVAREQQQWTNWTTINWCWNRTLKR